MTGPDASDVPYVPGDEPEVVVTLPDDPREALGALRDRGYVPVRIAPDVARDARVAARRAADARKAGRALDDLLGLSSERLRKAYDLGWSDGYAAQGLQHNRAYGVSAEDLANQPVCEHRVINCSRCTITHHYGVTPCATFVPFDRGSPEHGTCGGCGARYAEHHRVPLHEQDAANPLHPVRGFDDFDDDDPRGWRG